MVQIVWTQEEVANLDPIRRYIQQFDPEAARRMALRLIRACDSLQAFPNRGR
ncbi:type II toxin-antitoxin system RelE/ParE family toxin [Sphingomonas pollutisoli]|uniref:type II toxin-antitoxin system RelE/ParE family toxin n=1 Tax=Sphingomonas pollutisoli TaxID=3030829 RepID=UPI003B832975